MTAVLDPPQIIDVEVEVLRLQSSGQWEEWHESQPLEDGEQVALLGTNRGPSTVYACPLLRDMAGNLRRPLPVVAPLDPGVAVYVDAGGQLAVSARDVEMVLLVAASDWQIAEFVDRLNNLDEPPDDASVALFGVGVTVRPRNQRITNSDVAPLVSAILNPASEVREILALQGATLLPLPSRARAVTVERVRDLLRQSGNPLRARVIEIAANLGDPEVFRHLEALAADEYEPLDYVAARALAHGVEPERFKVSAVDLEGSEAQRRFAARYFARVPQPLHYLGKPEAGHPDFFWMALAYAQAGGFGPISELLIEADDIAFWRLVGKRSNLWWAVREVGPRLQPEFSTWLRIHAGDVGDHAKRFTIDLQAAAEVHRSPGEGRAPIPANLVPRIRERLEGYPELLEVEHYIPGSPIWDRISYLSPAERGVLLVQLLRAHAMQEDPASRLRMATSLVGAWAGYSWFPDLTGLRDYARDAIGEPDHWGSWELAAQIGWALSRSPLPLNVRLTMGNLALSPRSTVDMQLLVSCCALHRDRTPPPYGQVVQSLASSWENVADEDPAGIQARISDVIDRSDGAKDFSIEVEVRSPLVDATSDFDILLAVAVSLSGGVEVFPRAFHRSLTSAGAGGSMRFFVQGARSDVAVKIELTQAEGGQMLQELQGLISWERLVRGA